MATIDSTIRVYKQETVRPMAPPLVAPAAGTCICNDERGTDNFIYGMFASAGFYRYSVNRDCWQQLTNPPTTVLGAGMCCVFDPSYGTEGTVWMFGLKATASWCSFAAYDVATGVWTSKSLPTLTAAWAIDGELCHTCSSYNKAGNDDKIYLIGNNATVMYTYTISTDTWAVTGAPTALPAAAGAGCNLIWTFNSDPDNLLYFRGTATNAIYNYKISTDTWSSALTVVPAVETYTTGASSVYHPENDKLYIIKESTRRIYLYDILTQKIKPFQTMPITPGTSTVGQKIVFVASDSRNFLYFMPHTTRLLRSEVWTCI